MARSRRCTFLVRIECRSFQWSCCPMVMCRFWCSGKGEPGAGNVYVVMSTTGDAVKAQGVMHGRMFDGQQIVATFYDVAKAEAGQFE